MKQALLITIFVSAVIVLLTAIQPAAAKTVVFNNNLSFGSVGEEVKELQRFLNANNYILATSSYGSPGEETTYFGRLTRASLIKFQKAHNITPPFGFFGPITRRVVNSIIAGSNIPTQPDPTENPVNNNADTSAYYSIGGTITGLAGPVKLLNNGGDELVINPGDDSAFTFSKKLKNGESYFVTAISLYANQNCYFRNNAGVVAGASVTTVQIACGVNLYFNPFQTIFGGAGSAAAPAFICGEDLVDGRDNQIYTTVQIGGQCWMAENINVGTQTAGINNQTNADNGVIEKYCYADDAGKCETDGGLYQWHTAMAFSQSCDNHLNTAPCVADSPHQGLCPSGWHLPSFSELQALAQISDPGCDLNCDSGACSCTSAGGKMKADPGNLPIAWDGTNDYDLAIIPSGIRSADGAFSRYGVSVNLWTSTALSGNAEYSWFTSFFGVANEFGIPPNGIYGGLNFRPYGYSVRCIKN